jgi:hypothetical protein
VGHTTADISDVQRVHQLAARLQSLVDTGGLSVCWDDGPNFENSHSVAYESISDDQLGGIYAQGGITLASTAGKNVRASVEWNKVHGKDIRKFLKSQGYLQNRVTVQLDSHFLEDSEFRDRMLRFADCLAVDFDVSLLYVYDPLQSDGRYFGSLGLGVGLRDVYWLTVFGPQFVEIIGRETLLGCPAAETRELRPNMILVRIADTYPVTRPAPEESAWQDIRSCIGEPFFARTQLEQAPDAPGSGSLLNPFRLLKLARFLTGAKRQFDDDSIKAEVRPEFDWSNILIRDATGRL